MNRINFLLFVALSLVPTAATAQQWDSGFGRAVVQDARGKYGLNWWRSPVSAAQERVIVSPQYDWLESGFNEEGYLSAKLNGRFGVIDTLGRVSVPLQYDYALPCRNGFARVITGRKYSAVGCKGGAAVPGSFDYLENFNKNGTAAAVRDSAWGVIGKDGRTVVPFKYYYIMTYPNGFMRAFANNKFSYLLPDGTPWLDDTHTFNIDEMGNVVVSKGAMYGVFGRDGRQLLPMEYSNIKCERNTCVVRKNRLSGAFDLGQQKLVLPIEHFSLSLSNGIIMARNAANGPVSFLNSQGKPLFGRSFDDARHFDETGFALVKQGMDWGVISRSGRMVINFEIPTQADKDNPVPIRFTGDGRIIAAKRSGWGVADTTGKVLIPFLYVKSEIGVANLNDKSPFDYLTENLYFGVGERAGTRQGLMGPTGTWILPLGAYDEVETPRSASINKYPHLAAVKKNGRVGIIDVRTRAEIVPLQYKWVSVSDGYAAFGYEDRTGVYIYATKQELIGSDFSYMLYDSITQRLVGSKPLGAMQTAEGLIDRSGKPITGFVYTELVPDSGQFSALSNGKLGYLDAQGRTIVPFVYDRTQCVTHCRRVGGPGTLAYLGARSLIKGGSAELLDLQGRVIATNRDFGGFPLEAIKRVRFGSIIALLGEHPPRTEGSVSRYDLLLNGTLYTEVGGNVGRTSAEPRLENGLLAVKQNGKFGYIDEAGRVVLPFQFDDATYFRNGIAYATRNGRWSIIGRNGEIVPAVDQGVARAMEERRRQSATTGPR